MRTLTNATIDWSGKNVFCRVDLNVPLTESGDVADDERIVQALPTIKHLMEQGARIILGSHLGRPKGKARKQFSLEPVAIRLQQLLGTEIVFANDCVGNGISHLVNSLNDGQILLLGNLRFHSGEEKGDDGFARQLANKIDVYVGDAFGAAPMSPVSNRYCSSRYTESGWILMEKVLALAQVIKSPKAPFVAILGAPK